MKATLHNALRLLLLALPPFAAAQPALPPQVTGTDAEFHAVARDGAGGHLLVVTDRATGLARVATLDGTGLPDWAPDPANFGMEALTGMTLGPLDDPAADTLAAVNLWDNRVNLVDPRPAVGGVRSILPAGSVGPAAVAATRVAGLAQPPGLLDIAFFEAVFNPTSDYNVEIAVNTGGAFNTPVVSTVAADPAGWAARFESAMGPAAANRVLLRIDSPGTSTFEMRAAVSGPVRLDTVNTFSLPVAEARAVYGDLTPGGRAVIAAHAPGESEIHVRRWNTATSSFDLPGTHDLGFPVGRLAVIPYGAQLALLAVGEDRESAGVFLFDESLGISAGSVINAPAGRYITGAAAHGPNRAHVFYGDADGRTTGVRTYDSSSGLNLLNDSGLPSLPRLGRGTSVLLYDGTPFIDPGARVVARIDGGVWTNAFTIAGGTMFADGERFLGPAAGLGDPQTTNLGAELPGIGGALVNQISDSTSFFAASAAQGVFLPEAVIDPPPGEYEDGVVVTFEVPDMHGVFYRADDGASPWQLTADSGPHLFTDTSLLYLVWDPANSRLGPLRRAVYTITKPPAAQDLNEDGIPDFVRSAYGLDPGGPDDTDADGFSDLQELLAGTDPLDPDDFPVDIDGNTDRLAATWFGTNALDVEIAPLSRSPDPAPAWFRSFPKAGETDPDPTLVAAYDLYGSLLGSAPTTAPAAGDTLAMPAARMEGLRLDETALFLVFATEANFPVQSGIGDQSQGRELIAVRPMPLDPVQPFVYTDFGNLGGLANLTAEADAWVAAAQAYYFNLQRPVLAVEDFDYRETLAALLLEAFIGRELYKRGTDPDASLDPVTEGFPSPFISLTRFRGIETAVPVAEASGDPAQTVIPTRAHIRALRRQVVPHLPAYDLPAVFETLHDAVLNPPAAAAEALLELAEEIHRLSAANAPDGSRRAPVTALRRLIRHGDLDTTGYAADPTLPASLVNNAAAGAEALLDLPAAREFVGVYLLVTPDSIGDPLAPLPELLGFAPTMDPADAFPGTGLATLVDSSHNPLHLPRAFNLPPGSIIEANGLLLAGAPGAAFTLEVIPPVTVVHLELPAPVDSNDNLIPDALEELFPDIPLDPFADLDGDGFSLLQELIDGTNPFDPDDFPAGDPLDLSPPVVGIIPANPTVIFDVGFQYPAAAAPYVGFRLHAGDDLETFTDTGIDAAHLGGGQFGLSIDTGGNLPAFFTFRMYLK